MKLKYLSLLSIFIFGITLSQPFGFNIDKELQKGLYFFNLENPTKSTDNEAKKHFLRIANLKPRNKAEAIKIAKANEKLGIINQTYFQNQQASAYYKKSIEIAQQNNLADTSSFPSMLYLSGLHYYNSTYDSCLYYLSAAEILLDKNPKLPEAERLFNTKGVLLFESGNFRQSLIYFKKAESLLDTDLLSNLNNQALALQYLNQLDSTFKILNKLKEKFPHENAVNINLASILIELNQPLKAISIIGKPTNDSVIYLNTLGKAYFKLNNLQRSKQYFTKSIEINNKKKADKAYSHYYLGKIAAKENSHYEALFHYQMALQKIDLFFNQKNIFKNPVKTSSGFYSFFVLEILAQKALSFGELYKKTSKLYYLRGAINAYESFRISANNISKTYNQEDARLDIIDELHPKYQAYIKLLWDAYIKTNELKYAERAFEISEESKASVLSLGINENAIKNNSDIPVDLLKTEKILQISLAALKKNFENITEKSLVEKQLKAINETEMKLGKLNEKLEQFPDYKWKKFQQNQQIKIDVLRNHLEKNQAILSYIELENKGLVFCLTKTKFKAIPVEKKVLFEHTIKDLKAHIRDEIDLKANKTVYKYLIKPFENIIKSEDQLIFIGDGITNGMPLECLKDQNGKYLVETHPVSYLFSAKFIQPPKKVKTSNNILAFAPFSSEKNSRDFLPNSKVEIENLPNSKRFFDKSATKQAFIDNANEFSIIHLATHSVANLEFPEKSYIKFQNSKNHKEDNRLYLFEFTAGMLKNTKLVFLSACDSYGNTNLDGEGIRGLSRGFYLAGSQSIISSLWKAEDYSTAYLTKKFYEHLADGATYPIALQKAKLDLIEDPTIVQFRHPKYWAHLVYVGFQKDHEYWIYPYLKYFLGTLAILFAVFLFKKNFLSMPKS